MMNCKFSRWGTKGLIIGLCLVGALANASEAPPATSAINTKEELSLLSKLNQKVPLLFVSKGIRNKKVLSLNIKVYQAELFVSKPQQFKKLSQESTALQGIEAMQASAIRLKFLRNVEASQLQKSLSDAMKANHVDLNDPKLQEFVGLLSGDQAIDENQTVTIAADRTRGAIVYQSPSGKMREMRADSAFISKVFSIWLGIPADGGLEDLKKELLS